MPEHQKAKDLAKRWGLSVQQPLYRKTGDWYHQLRKFPGALLDADGYVIFENEESFKACPQLRIGKHPNRHGGWVYPLDKSLGIKAIPGYTYVAATDPERDSSFVESSTSPSGACHGARLAWFH